MVSLLLRGASQPSAWGLRSELEQGEAAATASLPFQAWAQQAS
eukprot:CAMPEP_0170506514 /NCGR_PEP_ID=MMETSP0208-20121228/55187_1 /TAXON_ID=197538 /ORGANISM="Strombidium inclinatum, Strain S3" /LENGTH=42 /DNA_ID= /DNA_START= /DNA_END= /DNA_ORIENTATION=